MPYPSVTVTKSLTGNLRVEPLCLGSRCEKTQSTTFMGKSWLSSQGQELVVRTLPTVYQEAESFDRNQGLAVTSGLTPNTYFLQEDQCFYNHPGEPH